jgi:penicillin-insensitive murein endopeptidase
VTLALVLAANPAFAAVDGVCYGSVNDGAITGAVRMDADGPNFTAYSYKEGVRSRFFIDPRVRTIMLEAFTELSITAPQSAKFVIAELGLEHGGKMKPHVSHQNGTSVDLLFPVKTRSDATPIQFTSNALNGSGYKEHFDSVYAKSADGLRVVDFELLGEYLFQLSQSAKKHGHSIGRVVLIKEFQWKLFDTKHGGSLQRGIRWLDDPADRHDQHVHVDFDIPCKSLSDYPGPTS